MYDVILLLKHPPTAIESGVVEMTWVLEPLETYLPETCKDGNVLIALSLLAKCLALLMSRYQKRINYWTQ